MKKTLSTLMMTSMLILGANAAQAQDFESMSKEKRHEMLKNMTEEQRKEFMEARKAKWEAMSDSEKVKVIEERRAQFIKEKEKEWNSLSDAEKIKKAEERMKHHKRGGEHGGKRDGKRPPRPDHKRGDAPDKE